MINLMRYLPDYYESVREINLLMDTENPELESLWADVSRVKANQFILTSDESKIRQWEQLLRIRPDSRTQSLDYRKAVVIMRLSTRLPLTYRWLEEKLTEIVGEGNFVISLFYNDYHLYIRLTNDSLGLIGELRSYLREKIPANLGLTVEELFKNWHEALHKYYLFWGCVPIFYNWADKTEDKWGSALSDSVWHNYKSHIWTDCLPWIWGQNLKSWYAYVDNSKTGGVVSQECWWTRFSFSWEEVKNMNWLTFCHPNTWQDVKNYVWEDETA